MCGCVDAIVDPFVSLGHTLRDMGSGYDPGVNVLPAPIAFVIFIVTFIAARIAQERALGKLDTQTKGRLVEAFASHRLVAMLPLAGIAAGYVAVSMFEGLSTATMLAIYFPAVLVMVAAIQLSIHRKLLALGIDREFVRVYTLCRIATFVALAAFVLVDPSAR